MSSKISAETLASFLRQVPLFSSCGADDLLLLVGAAEAQAYKAGAAILQASRAGAPVGVVLKGRATLGVVDAASGSVTRLEPLMPGDLFGEIGLLLGGASPVTVIADDTCHVLLLDRTNLDEVLRRSPLAGLTLAKRLCSRFIQVSLLGLGASAAAAPTPAAAPAAAAPAAPAPTPSNADGRAQIPFVEISDFSLTPDVLGLIPSQLVQKHRMLPLQVVGSKLTVGLVSPRSVEALQDLRRVLHTVDPTVVAISQDDFNQAFVRLKLDAGVSRPSAAGGGRKASITYTVELQKEAEKSQLVIGNEVITIFDRILADALDINASDIHLEPGATGVTVRYRVHGALVDRQEFISPAYAAPLVARIKVLSELDITDRRNPQDGRLAAQIGKRELNLRISTMPVARGEKVVIRIIDPGDVMRPLHQVFVNPDMEKAVRAAIAEPYGCIVVAGPTGSGKSSTLYSMLNERRLARPETSIVTVEDPVEFVNPGMTQVPVNTRVGLTFGAVLRGLLRQDPDVIMIGELREAETASIAIEAALTGHLVFTSIHGNNAAAVIQRLQHLGTDPVLLSQALSLVIVQRLAKRLCPQCVADSDVAPALLQMLVARRVVRQGSAVKLPRPVGCEACQKTGYLGRVAVQEVVQFDEPLREALASGVAPAALLDRARETKRLITFAQSAAYLMARRLLAPTEVLLVVAD